ncbi:DUF6438 domain-containing protein [Sphingomonas mollis]|uniref:DUF6438 domain-containing protein n=1 Tax=Sphingomonas mollis TaxID=2795726 RepID=A0ABS0XKV1_9SPHN|nr:DUF6438 domain-containing protein [Sphingomonas sp. BT553]MBJ6120395.1 hypothetical protein [Sphingomonas sp. BT553]
MIQPGAERLTIAVGPCYGTCPVYSIELAPDGTGRFQGKEHVAVSGTRSFRADVAAQGDLMASLAPYRPATGTITQTRCEQQVSDQPSYTLTWTMADGRSTMLTHDRGCLSAANVRLNEVLAGVPETLGLREMIGRR